MERVQSLEALVHQQAWKLGGVDVSTRWNFWKTENQLGKLCFFLEVERIHEKD